MQLDGLLRDVRHVLRSSTQPTPSFLASAVAAFETEANDLRRRLVIAADLSGPTQRDAAKALKPLVKSASQVGRRLVNMISEGDDSGLKAVSSQLDALAAARQDFDRPPRRSVLSRVRRR